jgi:hypothetical protein
MKKMYFLSLILFIINGCRTVNEGKLLGEIPECTNKICKKMEIRELEQNSNKNTVLTKQNYLLDIKYKNHSKGNLTSLTTLLSLGTLPLVGFPDYEEWNVDLEATLKTKMGTPIKTYQVEGPIKGNIAAILYGYSIDGAREASIIESKGEALRALYQQINTDEQVYADAEKVWKKEEQEINELKKILGNSKVGTTTNFLMSIQEIITYLNKGDIVYLTSSAGMGYWGIEKYGLFAGQNTYNGNLADYRTYQYGSDKIFIYGKNNYTDGQPLYGYYKYSGKYSYITIWGSNKTVPAFHKVSIPERLRKYIPIVNEMNLKNK